MDYSLIESSEGQPKIRGRNISVEHLAQEFEQGIARGEDVNKVIRKIMRSHVLTEKQIRSAIAYQMERNGEVVSLPEVATDVLITAVVMTKVFKDALDYLKDR